MSLSNLTGDSANGAFSCTSRAALTFVCVDREREKSLASACGALLVLYVCNVFIAEVAERGKNGVGGRLTEAAERSGFYVVAKLFEAFDVFHLAVALCDLFE